MLPAIMSIIFRQRCDFLRKQAWQAPADARFQKLEALSTTQCPQAKHRDRHAPKSVKPPGPHFGEQQLEVSLKTVKRDWAAAKVWLLGEMKRGGGS